MAMETWATFLGWCTVINIGVLLFSTVAIMIFKDPVVRLHSKLFGLNADDLPMMYFNYLGNYKIAIYMLNLVPYIALKVMA